jgi:hypothetical protein
VKKKPETKADVPLDDRWSLHGRQRSLTLKRSRHSRASSRSKTRASLWAAGPVRSMRLRGGGTRLAPGRALA